MGAYWYCVGIIRRKEAFAIGHLERQGYRVFCPRILKSVSHARKRTEKLVSLFPGYVFVELDLSAQRWRPIDGTFGVTQIVKSAGLPARVDRVFMERLEASADDSAIVHFNETLTPGDEVRSIGGALDDCVGRIARMKDADRVVVLMSMLGREVEVTLPRQSLVKAA